MGICTGRAPLLLRVGGEVERQLHGAVLHTKHGAGGLSATAAKGYARVLDAGSYSGLRGRVVGFRESTVNPGDVEPRDRS